MVLILKGCNFLETAFRGSPGVGQLNVASYKLNNKVLNKLSCNYIEPFRSDMSCYVILDKYKPDSDLSLTITTPSGSYYHGQLPLYMKKHFICNSINILQGDIVVDSNNDGILGGDDNQVEMQSPGHVFWVNDDRDTAESSTHDDNEVVRESPVMGDFRDEYINGIRDLEDFMPITINIPNIKGFKELSGIKFYLETEGEGSINIFKRSTADYLTKLSDSIKQYKKEKLYTISNKFKKIELDLDKFRENNTFYGVFEGATEGKVNIKLIAMFNNDAKEDTEIVLDEVVLTIKRIGDLYRTYNIRGKPQKDDSGITRYKDIVKENDGFALSEKDKIFVWTHGYRNTEYKCRAWSDTVFKRLYHQGFRGCFVSILWHGNEGKNPGKLDLKNKNYFDEQWVNSFQSGEAYADIIEDLHEELPNAKIITGAQSLGNNVMSYGIKCLKKRNENIIDDIVHMQAAIPGNAYWGLKKRIDFFDSMYVDCIQAVKDKVYNLYAEERDSVLKGFTLNIYIGMPTPLDNSHNLIDADSFVFKNLMSFLKNNNIIYLLSFHYDYLKDHEYFEDSLCGALGMAFQYSACDVYGWDVLVNPNKIDKFDNIDTNNIYVDENDRTDTRKERPYNIRKHSSMMYEYYFDVQNFYKIVCGIINN
jgi:hypothetical protein